MRPYNPIQFLQLLFSINENFDNVSLLGDPDNELILIITHNFCLDDLDIQTLIIVADLA